MLLDVIFKNTNEKEKVTKESPLVLFWHSPAHLLEVPALPHDISSKAGVGESIVHN